MLLEVVINDKPSTLLLFVTKNLDLSCNAWNSYSRCEPFDTYPRTYDLLHANGLFSVEKKRYEFCFLAFPFILFVVDANLILYSVHTNFSPNVICVRQRCDFSTIMLEMDRMLRPDGRVYVRDTISVIGEVNEIASALGWVPALRETGEGPHSSWRILICDKRMWPASLCETSSEFLIPFLPSLWFALTVKGVSLKAHQDWKRCD